MRSAKCPIAMPPRPVATVATEYAAETSARGQPNSAASGSRNTATVPIAPNAIATIAVHTPTMTQAYGTSIPRNRYQAEGVAAAGFDECGAVAVEAEGFAAPEHHVSRVAFLRDPHHALLDAHLHVARVFDPDQVASGEIDGVHTRLFAQ